MGYLHKRARADPILRRSSTIREHHSWQVSAIH
jgi:hypothetical protein